MPDSPIFVTRLTSPSPAAIAVIELRGFDAELMIRQFWQPATAKPLSLNEIRFGRWGTTRCDTEQQANSPEEVLVCLTADNVLEIHCHGGVWAAKRIIRDLSSLGAIELSLEDRLERLESDRYIRDAIEDLFLTKTLETTSRMLDQVRGAFSRAMVQIENHLIKQSFGRAIKEIDLLLDRYQFGKHLVQPWQVAIVGPPNVGKSSLLNELLGYERAIVHETPGTTRDLLSELTAFQGWPIQLVDTAGLRETEDIIEREGVSRAFQMIQEADLLLCLIDPFEGWTKTHEAIFNDFRSKMLIVHTKSDLLQPRPSVPMGIQSALEVSARFRDGIEELISEVIKSLIPVVPPHGTAIPFRESHLQSLKLIKEVAIRAMASQDTERAMPLSE